MTKSNVLFWWCLILGLTYSVSCCAEVELEPQTKQIPIKEHLHYYLPVDEPSTEQQVLQAYLAGEFSEIKPSGHNLHLIVGFTLRNNTNTSLDYYLKLAEFEGFIDAIALSIYDVTNTPLLQYQDAFGNQQSYAARRTQYEQYLANITIASQQRLLLLINYRASLPFNSDVQLIDEDNLRQQSIRLQVIFGLVVGALVALLCYNSFLAVAIKDLAILRFCGYLVCALLLLLIQLGYLRMHFFTQLSWPQWSKATPVLFALLALTGLQMSDYLLPTPDKRYLQISWILKGLCICEIATTLLFNLNGLLLNTAIVVFTAMIVSAIQCKQGIAIFVTGNAWGRAYALAWLMMLLLLVDYGGPLVGFDFPLIPGESMQIKMAIVILAQIFILSLCFNERIKRLQRQKLTLQRKLLEEQNEINQHLRIVDQLKDEFLAKTSVQLLAPLHGVIGLCDELLSDRAPPLTSLQQQQIDGIYSSAQRLAVLVEDVIDFTRLKDGELKLTFKTIQLKPLVGWVMAMCRPLLGDKPVTLNNELDDALPQVWADENRVQQILYNLIGNGIRHTESGSIAVTAKVLENHIQFAVTDSGVGIPPSKLSLLFTPFTSLSDTQLGQHGGAGLGLPICQKLVHLHNGEIKLTSTLQQGTEVEFTLPIAQQTEEQDKPLLSSNVELRLTLSAPQKNDKAVMSDSEYGPHLLVVDDDPLNRQVLIEQLKSEYRLSVAQNGLEAITLLECDDSIELVLLDWMMPVMSGYEACQLIRKRWSADKLPVILLTAKSQADHKLQGLKSGVNDYVVKPYSLAELKARIKTHLQSSCLAALLARQAQAQSVLNIIEEAVVGYRKDGKVVYYNQGFSNHFKVSDTLTEHTNIAAFITDWQTLYPGNQWQLWTFLRNGCSVKGMVMLRNIEQLRVAFIRTAQLNKVLALGGEQLQELDLLLQKATDGLAVENKTTSDSENAVSKRSPDPSVIVALMKASLCCWQQNTGKSKIELIEQSGLWRLYLDNGTFRSRTFDRYLCVDSIPQRPRWQKVVRTAHFVIDSCPVETSDVEALRQAVQSVERLQMESH